MGRNYNGDWVLQEYSCKMEEIKEQKERIEKLEQEKRKMELRLIRSVIANFCIMIEGHKCCVPT